MLAVLALESSVTPPHGEPPCAASELHRTWDAAALGRAPPRGKNILPANQYLGPPPQWIDLLDSTYSTYSTASAASTRSTGPSQPVPPTAALASL
jgi:hypothetical protein